MATGAIVAAIVVVAVGVFLLWNGLTRNPEPEESAAATAALATTTTTSAPGATTPPTSSPTTSTLPETAPSTTVSATEPPPTSTTEPPIIVTVGHWPASAVFQDRDDSGNLTGFEIELVDELMQRMGTEAAWIETDLTDLVDGTKTGRYDIAVAGLTITETREKAIRFTRPYFIRHHGLIVDPRVGKADLSFRNLTAANTVGVIRSSLSAAWAEASLGPLGVTVSEFDGPSAAFEALRSGSVDAVISAALFPSGASGRLSPLEVVDSVPTGEVVAIGVDPGQPGLRNTLDEHLTAMINDGTYQQIYDRWFDVASASVVR
ncbi:MAG: ABC transporter substrate-binding protein [Actinomycetota bacterium]|nr:ABC transporter substrate-binding protein [Actinomycetota bacterium]